MMFEIAFWFCAFLFAVAFVGLAGALWIAHREKMRPWKMTLRELGYPSFEELGMIGLSRADFIDRYVRSVSIRGCRDPEEYADKCLAAFYRDYPQLLQQRRA